MKFALEYTNRTINRNKEPLSREGDVDLLRALGIISMIIDHVEFGAIFRHWVGAFHMPIFFVVSGFFIDTDRSAGAFIKKKIKSLLIPYLFFGIGYEILWSMAGHNQWGRLIWPNTVEVPLNGALWFLPAIFFGNVISFAFLKYFNKPSSYIGLALIAIVGCFHLVILPFSLDSALVGCGFILIGYLIRQYGLKVIELKVRVAFLLLFISTVLIFFNGQVNLRTNEYLSIPLYWLNALMAIVALWSLCKWVDSYNCLRKLKEIGAESIIYVCMNQFILFFLWRVPAPMESNVFLYIWHAIEVIVIIASCFVINRVIKMTPLKFLLGK